MDQIEVLVTGTGRSGTVYLSRFLTSIGLMCGHESIFTPAGYDEAVLRLQDDLRNTSQVSSNSEHEWFSPNQQVAESSYMACPFIDRPLLENTKIIHLVRDPIKVISSTHIDANFFDPSQMNQISYMNFVVQHLPELSCIDNRLEKNVMFYILWNRLVEKKSKSRKYYRLRIEDGITQDFFDFLEMPATDNYYRNKKTNSWSIRKRDINYEEIPNYLLNDLRDLMDDYGYRIKKSII